MKKNKTREMRIQYEFHQSATSEDKKTEVVKPVHLGKNK